MDQVPLGYAQELLYQHTQSVLYTSVLTSPQYKAEERLYELAQSSFDAPLLNKA